MLMVYSCGCDDEAVAILKQKAKKVVMKICKGKLDGLVGTLLLNEWKTPERMAERKR